MLRLFWFFLYVPVTLGLVAPAAAQAYREHEIGARALAGHPGAAGKIRSYEASADARAIVSGIMKQIGLPMNLDVRAAPDVANAQALVETIEGREVRVILYNPDWMDNLEKTLGTDWTSVSILAHEIGHHLAGHLDPRYPNHAAELEADKFSGFILNKLGARLEQAQLAMAMISPEEASVSHPGRALRVTEIARGWNEAARGGAANVIKASLPTLPKPTAAPAASPRVALLVGNTNYTVVEKLRNPKNDVIAVQRELRRIGFSTTTLYDATAEQIAQYVRLFREDAQDADWALFYFAGRGVEIDGVNYMVPVDVDLESNRDIAPRYPQLRLDTAFAAIEPAATVRLVVADSCRIDPAHLPDASNQPPASVVFRVMEPPRGIVVAYSTRAGTYALDGDEDLSPFAKAFIAGLRTPGMELDKVFRRVNAEVVSATRGMQEPIVHGNWPAKDLHLTAN
jgi:hypothetical protein